MGTPCDCLGGNGTNEEGMERVWKFTTTVKSGCNECREPGSSAKLLLEDLGMTWPRYDTIVSPDNRSMNLIETRHDEVENMKIM